MKRNAGNNNEFSKARERARGYQSNRINNASTKKLYNVDFLRQLYDEWSAECTVKYNEFLSQNDLQGFKGWIESTKFTADRLKEKWEQQRKK